MVPDQERCDITPELRRQFAEIVAGIGEVAEQAYPEKPSRRAANWLRIALASLLALAGVAVALLAMVHVSAVAGVAGLAGILVGLLLGASEGDGAEPA